MINMTEVRVECGHERPLGLFEVLTRNRQSALGLSGRTKSAREKKNALANGSFDLPTFGLWAQRASAAPVRFLRFCVRI